MEIRDYDLLNHFGMLLEYPVFTYQIHADLKGMLRDAGIPYRELEVLPNHVKNQNIILGKDVGNMHVEEGYVFTDVGVRFAITKNIRSDYFPEEFRQYYIRNTEKKLYYKYLNAIVRLISNMTHIFPDVMVYSIGKTGSTTICASLDNAGLHWIKPHNVYKLEEAVGEKIASDWLYCLERLKKGVKIICLVRDPIARDISAFMQNLDSHLIESDRNVQEQLIAFLDQTSKQNCLYGQWFDHEMLETTGINVYDFPFDRERGYSILKKDHFEMLLLTLEKLDQNEHVIGEFVGKPDFKLIPSKIGDEKRSQHIYKELKKNVTIPYEILERNYANNKRLEHFYEKEEIAGFRRRWENNTEEEKYRIISDHELIKDPGILAQYPIVVYGCGQKGRELEAMLAAHELAGNIVLFCETAGSKKRMMGYRVVDLEELKNIADSKEVIVIISSDTYHYEMKRELVSQKVKAKYVFSNWGVRKALTQQPENQLP